MPKDFGDLEIKTKEDLIENLKGRNIKVSKKSALKEGLEIIQGNFQSFIETFFRSNNRIIINNGEKNTSINLVYNSCGVYSIIEMSSGKIVYHNPVISNAYGEGFPNTGPLSHKIKEEIASQGNFCYGKDNPLE